MLDGLRCITPKVHSDARGYFFESYKASEWGLPCSFVQDNESFSKKNVIRGMHYQKGQAKLVRCVRGTIFDVAVDIRSDSSTFGQWEGVYLDENNREQLFIPDGFAHGFAVLSATALVCYKVSSEYDPSLEAGFRYDDPSVGIAWPVQHPELSKRDAESHYLKDIFCIG